mgnify:CR=1 FL=1
MPIGVTPQQQLVAVQTYQRAGLAYLQNYYAFIALCNKKYQNFQTLPGQQGQTVLIQKPQRVSVVNSPYASFEGIAMEYQSLTADQWATASKAFTSDQFLYTIEHFMEDIGKSAVIHMGAEVEKNVAQNCINNTFRFYGDGVTPINSSGQLASALAIFHNFGSGKDNVVGILPDVEVASIVSSMLTQFVPVSNENLRQSYMLGRFANCDWYRSNMLQTQLAGTVGDSNLPGGTPITLTVTGTNDPTGANVTQIYCHSSGAINDAEAIHLNDSLYFVDGVSGQPNLRYLTYVGQNTSATRVQMRATAAAGTDGSGNITLSIYPKLQSTAGMSRNLSTAIQAGMQIKAIPSHKAAIIWSSEAMYLAMPQLPNQDPYTSTNEIDDDSKLSMLMYYGSIFGTPERGLVWQALYGTTLVPEYAIKLCFPLTSSLM